MIRAGRGLRRGSTLIDLMVAIAIVGILAHIMMGGFSSYQRVNATFREDVAIAWVLDAELARAANCPNPACLRALATRTATTTGLSPEASSWGRALVHRRASPLGQGLWRFDVTASLPHLRRPREASTIVGFGP